MVEQLVKLEKIHGDKGAVIFVLHYTYGENRWNTTFVRAIAAALDEVEAHEGPGALVTCSDDPKFFSNGLDLEWMSSKGDHFGGPRKVFNPVSSVTDFDDSERR